MMLLQIAPNFLFNHDAVTGNLWKIYLKCTKVLEKLLWSMKFDAIQ